MEFLFRWHRSIRQRLNSMPNNLVFLPSKSRLSRLFANRKQQNLGVEYASFWLQTLDGLMIECIRCIECKATPMAVIFKLHILKCKYCRECQGGFCALYI